MPRKSVVIAAAARSPIGKFGGALASLSAVELGAHAARGVLARSGIESSRIREVIFGHARQAGAGPNPARQVGRRAGLPDSVPAFTVNKACGSSLKAIILAYQSIALGEADLILAGGHESMSNTPYLLPRARWGYRMGHAELVDGMVRDGFLCPLCGVLMGETAENLARQYGISREAQDAYAVESQRRAAAAAASGALGREIVPIEVAGKKGSVVVERDEHARADATLESLAKLDPVFAKDGTVHAGNSSGITDGAAAMLVASETAARRLGLAPLARIAGYAVAGVDPAVMGIGPVPALRELERKTKVKLADVDLIELNEAFAAQVLACARDLPELDLARVNVHGGAIALGHPIGATGARVVTTLVYAMQARQARYGIATLCVSGGMGVAMLLERL